VICEEEMRNVGEKSGRQGQGDKEKEEKRGRKKWTKRRLDKLKFQQNGKNK
jgi:hypothetical protein